MSRRLAILTAQLQNRPLWENVPGNPLVQRNRETGMLRAMGLTEITVNRDTPFSDRTGRMPLPNSRQEQGVSPQEKAFLTGQWQSTTEELATNNGWFPITPEEREKNRYNKKVQIQVLRKDLLKWVDCLPDGYLNPTGSYRMREI